LLHTLRCCGELRRHIDDTSSAIRGSLSCFLRQSCGRYPQILVIVGFGIDGKSRRVCGCCRSDLHLRLRHNDRLSNGRTHLATSHPAAFQAGKLHLRKCFGKILWQVKNGVKLGVKDLRLGTVLPNKGALRLLCIYMMVTTACPLAAHSTHSRMASLPLTSAATSSSPAFLPSCVHLSVFQPSTGYRPARSLRRWPRWPGPGS
jgi:hypothetical protein